MLTVLVGLAVAWVPGAILGFAVGPGRQRWIVWAASPALTLGLVTLAMGWLPRVGLPNGVVAVMTTELVVAAAAVVAGRLLGGRRRHRGGTQTTATSTDRAGGLAGRVRSLRADALGVAIPSLLTIAYGWGLLGRFTAPPGWDAMNHGLLTRRILDTGSTAIPDVCSTGTTDPAVACSLYPLAANVTWAQAAHFSGGRISEAMTAWLVVIAPLALVVGVYACVRVFGAHPVVAACAALAPAFVGPVWTAMLIGRPTQQFGPSLAPAIALLVVAALRGPRSLRLGAMAGLAGSGLVMTHTYDALVVPVLGLGLLLAFGLRDLRWRSVLGGSAALVTASLVTTAPFLTRLLGAEASLGQTPPRYVGKPGAAAYYWVVDPMRYVLLGYPAPESNRDFPLDELQVRIALAATIVALLASPLCLVFRRLRWGWPWLLSWAVFTALGIWTSSSDSPTAQMVAGLWYGTRDRLRAMMLASYGILAVVGACALGLVAVRLYGLVRRPTRQDRAVVVVPAATAVALVLTLLGTALVPQTWRPLRADLARRTPTQEAYPRVYRWLAANTPGGEVIATNNNLEFMPWAYVDYGVGLLFGQVPHTEPGSRANYNARSKAWNWLVDNKSAVPSGCLVRHFGVRYVVTSTSRVPGAWAVRYQRKRLANSPHLFVAHKDGPITVYGVTESGRACAPDKAS